MSERKAISLRLDPAVHHALASWANEEKRSTNAQIEFLLCRALINTRRLPRDAQQARRRGRPRAIRPSEAS